jgi:hypothetical protein
MERHSVLVTAGAKASIRGGSRNAAGAAAPNTLGGSVAGAPAAASRCRGSRDGVEQQTGGNPVSDTPRKGQVGDWFVVPLPDSAGLAVGHAVRAQRDGTVLAYFFGPFPEPPPLTVCADLDPADAETALVCGARTLETGEWPLLGRTDVDPDVWPVPEFEKRVNVAPGRQESFAVRKEADLLRDAATRPLSDSERGQRPFSGVFGDVAVARHLAFRISAAEPRVGRQAWWQHPPPTDPTDGSDHPIPRRPMTDSARRTSTCC